MAQASPAQSDSPASETHDTTPRGEPREPDSHTEPLDEVQVKRCLEAAEELKQEGNDHFREKRWNEALAAYRSGLGQLPKRIAKYTSQDDKGKQKENLDDLDAENKTTASEDTKQEHDSPTPLGPEPTALETECAKARAVINANIGACYVKLGEHKEVVAACTESLRDDPNYIKALQRRASANEQLATWSSLAGAQEDYNKLLTLLPPSSPQVSQIKRELQALQPRLEAAQKRETADMLDKLKGLGNSVLGNFGLSTDNFQFVPNGQGGYSMNFVR